MEHMLRVVNEADRQTLTWLRARFSEASLVAAAQACASGGKPYLSRVCRKLGVRPPWLAHTTRQGAERNVDVGDRHLSAIRHILLHSGTAPQPTFRTFRASP
jgi:hypothetical protein